LALVLAPAAGAAPTQQPSVIIPLFVHQNRPLAMLTIGDHVPTPVVFDTGTDENIVGKQLADEFGLRQVGTSPLVDLGSGMTETVPVVAVPDAKLGGIALATRTAQSLARAASGEAGIFGPNSFGDSYVVIEAGHDRVRIVPRDSGLTPPGPGTPYKDRLPSVPIQIGGRTVIAHLDSGNSGELILGGDLMKKVPLTAPAEVVGIAVSALGEREVFGGQLKGEVRVGPAVLRDPQVSFNQSGTGGNVGYAIMRDLTIILDPAGQRSWVLDPAAEKVQLSDYMGAFGPRRIWVQRGKLMHQREGRPAHELTYLGGDLFEISATGDRIQFFRNAGRVSRLELITAEDDVVGAERSK
jgi:hypothetical protein